jgi:dTDP-4-amino-4,6-dideoxygalactose transaminase
MIKYIQRKSINPKLFQEALKESHERNHFSNNGPAKVALEKKLDNLLDWNNDKAVLCTANGTLALHAIYLFLHRRNKNFKIVSPSFTFPSCAVGFADIDLLDIDDTYTMPLTDENINNYDIFVITNLFGTYPPNIKKWIEKCKQNNKILIFDNASSPMTQIDGINMCNFGDFSFGSLHHTKYLGFGEGGFIVLPKHHYEEFTRILGFGFQKDVIKRKYDRHSSNYKISDVSCASILQHINTFNIEEYKQKQKFFLEQLQEVKGIKPFNYTEGVVYGNMPIVYKNSTALGVFRKNGIEAQKYYYPLVEHKNSMFLFDRIVNLPFHLGIKESEIKKMVNIVKESLGE